ncbi:MAG: hypothetical protein WDZ76_12310 [Pseudohongiellaceae bacterium]
MEKLDFRTIEKEEEISSYLKKYESYVGSKLPLEYVKNSRVVGVFLHEQLVGGYMLVTKPGFRSVLFVPDAVKKEHEFFKNDDYEMMEVNGVWVGPALKTAKQNFTLWINLIKDMFMSKKKYVLLMGDARNKTIAHLHSLTNPEKLYEGAPTLTGGDTSHANIRVSYTTRWNILLNVPRYWLEYKARERKLRRKVKNRTFARTIKSGGAELI